MKLRRYIGKLKKKLPVITEKSEVENDKDNLLYLESQLTLSEFYQLTESLTQLPQYYRLEITDHLEPFQNFLSRRFERNQNTPAMALIDSPGNRLCTAIAVSLSDHAKEPGERSLKPSTVNLDAVNAATGPDGEDGWNRLRAVLRGDVRSREQLVTAIQKYPVEAREKYLQLYTLDELTRLILQGDEYINAVKNSSAYNGNEAHDSSVLFLFTIYYRRQLESRQYESAGLFGWRWTGYLRKDKLDASYVPYSFLLEGGQLADFEGYMKKVNFAELRGALTQKDSALGTLTNQFLQVTTPDYRKVEAISTFKP
jgi:hypothetical protein